MSRSIARSAFISIARSALIAIMLLGIAALSFSQEKALATGEQKAVVDGTIKPGEYGFTQDFGQVTLCLNRTADTLYVAVVGNTAGWVAVGLGSL